MPRLANNRSGKMTKTIKIICSATILFIAQSAFACDYPSRVLIPNGSTATKEDMLNGQRNVKSYVSEMESYLDCIVEEEKVAVAAMDDLEPEDEQQREDMINKKYNAAVDEMERLAAQFNAEVQAYKAKNDS
jgi:hypothetical protein